MNKDKYFDNEEVRMGKLRDQMGFEATSFITQRRII
jgi:hypothetical protein